MDLEDIEDLYATSEEPMERLQVNEVVARVKRHHISSSAKSKQVNGSSVQQADQQHYETLDQALNGAFDSISEDDDEDDDDEDDEDDDKNTNGDDEFESATETKEEEQVSEEATEDTVSKDNEHWINKKQFRAQQKVNKKPKCASSCSCEKNNSCKSKKASSSPFTQESLNSALPGRARIYVKTWGCAHNSSDSEYMAGLLNSYGYTIVDEPEAADLWLLNSCTVKQPAETHFANYIKQALEQGKRVVVAGCVSQSTPNTRYLSKLSVVGVQQIDRVVEVVEETLKGNTVRLLGVRTRNKEKEVNGETGQRSSKRMTRLNMPKIRRNPLIEIIAINVGCLNQCTYCKTQHARGLLASYSLREIVERVLVSVQEGVREIWLTSEDTGAYGKDLLAQNDYEKARFEQLFDQPSPRITTKNSNLLDQLQPTIANLLQSVLCALPMNCRLRLGMTNPPYILEHLADIARIMQTDQRIYKFLHIPIQSGSDSVLGDMKREYSVKEFEHIMDYMRANVPGITVATDLILGFPTETEEDFEQTMSLIEKYKFPSLFINQFYPRPGTPAAKMTLIPPNQVRLRTKRASNFFRSYFPYENRVGQVYQALVTELSSDRQHYVAHNEFYEQILVPKDDFYMGKIIEVEIISTTKFSMVGKPATTGCLVRLVDHVKRHWNTNTVLLGSIAITSIILVHRLRKHLL